MSRRRKVKVLADGVRVPSAVVDADAVCDVYPVEVVSVRVGFDVSVSDVVAVVALIVVVVEGFAHTLFPGTDVDLPADESCVSNVWRSVRICYEFSA